MHYLEVERGLPGCIDDRLCWTLRFHPRCPRARDVARQAKSPTLKIGAVEIPIVCITEDPLLTGSQHEQACACHFPHDS